jgi:hypothetical protein
MAVVVTRAWYLVQARKGQLKEECTRCMERLEAANEEARRFKETLAERTAQHADCRQKFKLAQACHW